MIVTVDTGGTKTLVASFDYTAKMGSKHRFQTPTDSKAYFEQLLLVLRANYQNRDVEAIIIAIPGIINNNIIVGCGNLPWKKFDLVSLLTPYYSCPI